MPQAEEAVANERVLFFVRDSAAAETSDDDRRRVKVANRRLRYQPYLVILLGGTKSPEALFICLSETHTPFVSVQPCAAATRRPAYPAIESFSVDVCVYVCLTPHIHIRSSI